MNELQRVFTYEGKRVRTVTIDGEPWFVAKDVCDILMLGDTHKVVERLEDDERNSIPVTDSMGRSQDTWVVNESGLYSLILGSRKPEAKVFKRWVTHEVLPAIRRHGMYMMPDVAKMALEDKTQFLAHAVLAAQDVINDMTAKLAAAKPAVEFVERYVEATALKNFREVAKILGVKERVFISRLLEWGIVFRQGGTLLPYATYHHKGYFEVKTGEKGGFAYHQTKFTPAGIAWIAQRFADLEKGA